MLRKAAPYLLPIGITAVCVPSAVFAAEKKNICPADIYDEPKKEKWDCPPSERDGQGTELERLVMKCREEFGPLKDKTSGVTSQIFCVAKQSMNVVSDNVVYLRTRAPDEVRIGTIVMGGLLGSMLGFRRGLTRKLFFGTLGAAGASYVAYPKESVYYYRNGFSIAKKYAAVGYNFVVGESLSDCPRSSKSRSEDPESKSCPITKLKEEKAERDNRNSKDGKPESKKCPPMPTTDCSDCKPKWLSCPPSISRNYSVPEGVVILPISVGGRHTNEKSDKCAKCECGQDKKDSAPAVKPKVSANCPMMKPRCPGLEGKKDEPKGFLAKLSALFGKDENREKTPLESLFGILKVEDEQIRHHRDVFNPELVVRKDGYLCPGLKRPVEKTLGKSEFENTTFEFDPCSKKKSEEMDDSENEDPSHEKIRGGMSLDEYRDFIWKETSRVENSLEKIAYENATFDGFSKKKSEEEEGDDSEMDCSSHSHSHEGKIKGGMNLNEYRDFIWEETSK